MGMLSDRLAQVRPSPTMAMTARAATLRAAGHDVIGLSAGEPDFGTPEHICTAAKAAIDAGHTRYTAVDGCAELKAAICEKFRRDNALAYAPGQISVGAGGKHVLWNALMATLNPGDEVVIPAPFWVSYPDMVRMAGGTPVAVAAGPGTGYRITPEALDAAITHRTKWLILNSPSNPTGAGYDAAALAELAAVLLNHPQVWVLSDDIYEHLVFDGFRFATPAQVEPRLYDRTVTVNGVSKAYAMTGWRIGFAGGPESVIRAMGKVQSQSTSNPCSVSQRAAIAALNGPQDQLARNRALFQRRRDLVVQMLNACPGIACPVPQGAFYVYPSIDGLIGKRSRKGSLIDSDEAFATALLEETGVAVVFGAAFGRSPAFRVSYAADDESLRTACARIQDFCAGLR